MATKLKNILGITQEKVYNQTLSLSQGKTFKSELDSAVKTFLKGLLAEKPYFGLDNSRSKFKTYKDILEFISQSPVTKESKITLNGISKLKNRKIIIKPVKKTDEIAGFVEYVKSVLPEFKEGEFYSGRS
jgi:isopentenyl diphosphate isomerase/L-lactate dehydrogenase-like FMN-dependent dehydrogenase